MKCARALWTHLDWTIICFWHRLRFNVSLQAVGKIVLQEPFQRFTISPTTKEQ